MHKPRLLLVITKANWGGAQRHVYDVATSLKNDYDVMVASAPSGPLVDALKDAGITHYPIAHLQRDVVWIKELRALLSLWHLLETTQPNIVHLHSSKAGVLGALVSRLWGVERIVFTAHGWAFNEHRPLWWRGMIWCASWVTALLSHAIITVSHYDRTCMHMPFVTHKTRTIYPGIRQPIPLLERTAARESLYPQGYEAHKRAVWVGMIAELTPNKNITLAIDAVADYAQQNASSICLTVIGDGELRTELTRYIHKKNVADQVTLVGHKSDAAHYLAAFDVFLLTSNKEGFPYVLLEAGAAGIPIIARDVGGVPELIKESRTGLLVASDATSVSSAITRYRHDPALRIAVADTLAETITTKHSLETMVSHIREVYEECA